MSIPSRQIGWSQESNLLWNISKQLNTLTGISGTNFSNIIIALSGKITNEQGVPAFYADTFINIPAPGESGRLFVSTDTFAFYRDNGVGWDLIGGPGTGTVTGTGTTGKYSLFSGSSVIGDGSLTEGVSKITSSKEFEATKLIATGGTSAEILAADGSVITAGTNITISGGTISAAGGTSTNIYNSDGTLTANRTLTNGGFNLSLVGSSFTNRFTAAGRLLLGTTTESVYIADIKGNFRITTPSPANRQFRVEDYKMFFGTTFDPGGGGFALAGNLLLPGVGSVIAWSGSGNFGALNVGGEQFYQHAEYRDTSIKFKIQNNSTEWIANIFHDSNPSNIQPNSGSLRFYTGLNSTGYGNIILCFDGTTKKGNVVIGSQINYSSSILTADSTTQGFLPPRMTTAQKNAIVTPAAGLVLYDTDLAKLCVYTTGWETITSL